MKGFGIALIIWGLVGLFLGHIMFGDIGVSSTYSAITSIVVGVAFIKLLKLPTPKIGLNPENCISQKIKKA